MRSRVHLRAWAVYLGLTRLAVLPLALSLVAVASAFDVQGTPYGSIAVDVGRDPQNANVVQVRTVSRSGTPRASGGLHDVRLRILRTSAGASVTVASFTGQGVYNEGNLVASYSVSGTVYLWFNVWNYNDGVAAQAVIGPVTVDAGGNVGFPPELQWGGSFSIPGNPTDHPIKYSVTQGGNVVGTVEQAPGAPPIVYNVPGLQGGTPLHLNETTPGVKATPGGGFEADPGGPGYTREVGTVIPTQGSGGGTTTPAPVTAPTAPVQPASGGPAVPAAPSVTVNIGDSPLKPVWVPKADVAPGTTPGQSTSDFTISAYREGVDRQITSWKSEAQRIIDGANANAAKVDAVTAAVNAAASDAATKATQANDKLEAIKQNTFATANALGNTNAKLDTIATNTSGLASFGSLFSADKTQFDVTAKVNEGKSMGEAAVANFAPVKPTGSAPSISGGGSTPGTISEWEVTPGHTVTLSLGAGSGVWSDADALLLECRPLILWALVVWFIWQTSKTLTVYIAALPQVGQAESNTGIENLVPGVSQGKTWGAAAIIVGVVLGMVAASLAIVDTWATSHGLGIGALFQAVDMSAVGGAFGLLDRYLPLVPMVSLGVMRAGLPYFVAPLYVVAASVIKFTKA